MAKKRRVLNTGSRVTNPAWQRAAQGGGGGGALGTLGRVVDVISRPLYGMAEGSRRSLYTSSDNPSKINWVGSPSGFARGFGAGLSGKKKTTGQTLLEQGGLTGGWQRSALGFGLDVGLDPLTYLTLGTGTVAKTAGKKGLELGAEQIGREGLDVGLETALRQTSRELPESMAKQLASQAAPTSARPGLADALVDATRPGATTGRTAGRTVQLKLLGKPIAESERLGSMLSAAGAGVRGSRAGALIGETFSPAFGQSKEFHNLQRMYVGRSRSLTHDLGQEIRTKIKSVGLTKDEDLLLRKAINRVDGLTVQGLDERLRPVGEWLQDVLDETSKLEGKLSKVEKAGQQPLELGQFANRRGTTFKDYETWRGSGKMHDRATHNTLLQFDEAQKKYHHSLLLDEAIRRWPQDAGEIQNAMRRAKSVFGVQGENQAAWQHHLNWAQRGWKRWVTAYRPGFHLRNMMGDAFNNYLAGVNPKWYERSARVITRDAEGTVKIGGRTMTSAELNHAYRQAGLETSFLRAEELDQTTRGFGAKLTEFGDKREKFGRMANFMDGLDRELSKGTSLETAIERSGARTRKYLFDYGDLTEAERKIRTFLPFYTWTRKELPLILEHTITSPAKISMVPKGTRMLEGIMGIPPDPDDPFPGLDAALPEWLKDKQVIQMPGSHVLSPGLPTDIMEMMTPKGFAQNLVEGVTPLARVPYALTTGKELGTGFPQTESPLRYLLAQGPYGTLARANSSAPIRDRLINILTGAGYRRIE